MRWLNGPCTDPAGRVFTLNGGVFRALFPNTASATLSILKHPAVEALMDEGLVARMRLTDRTVQGYGPIVEIEKAPFDVSCGRFTRNTLRSAALVWIEITKRLFDADFALTDAHFGNYMLFDKNQPRWIDLGSIRSAQTLPDQYPYRAFDQLWKGMLAPLVVLESQPKLARLARLCITDQPYQGPLTVEGELPLEVECFAKNYHQMLLSSISTDEPRSALEKTQSFIEQLPHAKSSAKTAYQLRLSIALRNHIAGFLESTAASTIACIGGHTYLELLSILNERITLVIDYDEESLDLVETSLRETQTRGSAALLLEHPVNRFFLKNSPSADVVIALDPLSYLKHSSQVSADNIADILGALGKRFAIIIVPVKAKIATMQMLESQFRITRIEGFGWLHNNNYLLYCERAN